MINKNSLTQEQIKKINRVNILTLIREESPKTRYDIATALGLSIPTVSANINEMVKEGLLSEQQAASSGGRRPVMLSLIEDARFSIGITVEIKRIRIMMMNLAGDNVVEEAFQIPELIDNHILLSLLADIIQAFIVSSKVERSRILGIGIALPGTVDEAMGFLIEAPNLHIRNCSFASLEKSVGLPVIIENEANIGAFAEHSIGTSKNIDNLVYVSVTNGVGCGIIVKGHIYKGNHKRSGEFGHIRISDQPIMCNCGRQGCLELFASNTSMIQYYRETSQKEVQSIDEIIAAVEHNDAKAITALERYFEYLRRGLDIIDLALSPDAIVIGGRIANHRHIVSSYIKKVNDVPVLFSSLGDSAALIGAAMNSFQSLLSFSNMVL